MAKDSKVAPNPFALKLTLHQRLGLHSWLGDQQVDTHKSIEAVYDIRQKVKASDEEMKEFVKDVGGGNLLIAETAPDVEIEFEKAEIQTLADMFRQGRIQGSAADWFVPVKKLVNRATL